MGRGYGGKEGAEMRIRRGAGAGLRSDWQMMKSPMTIHRSRPGSRPPPSPPLPPGYYRLIPNPQHLKWFLSEQLRDRAAGFSFFCSSSSAPVTLSHLKPELLSEENLSCFQPLCNSERCSSPLSPPYLRSRLRPRQGGGPVLGREEPQLPAGRPRPYRKMKQRPLRGSSAFFWEEVPPPTGRIVVGG